MRTRICPNLSDGSRVCLRRGKYEKKASATGPNHHVFFLSTRLFRLNKPQKLVLKVLFRQGLVTTEKKMTLHVAFCI